MRLSGRLARLERQRGPAPDPSGSCPQHFIGALVATFGDGAPLVPAGTSACHRCGRVTILIEELTVVRTHEETRALRDKLERG
jgi:hypothetical protein